MALNRHRTRHLAAKGHRGAKLTLWLLGRVDRMLGMILIGNTLINAGVTALVTALAINYFGNNESVISIATAVVAFLIIVFSEITPKVIGAAYPEKIALPASFVLKPLLTLMSPLVWFTNLFVNGLLKLMRINPQNAAAEQRVSPEELRSMVLEAGNFIPTKHRSILLNLFDLESVSVDDVMTPRAQIEGINLALPIEAILHDLETCYHNKLLVYEGEIDNVAGILHVRKTLSLLQEAEPSHAALRELLTEPNYIPSGNKVFQQLQYFQESRQRTGLVVNEYGEIQGLVTLEDIIEEMIGEFTTSIPTGDSHEASWDEKGEKLVEGTTQLRDLNRKLGLDFPVDGPKTLNGLILEHLQELPESAVSVRLAGCVIEVVQIQNQSIKMVKLFRPNNLADNSSSN